MSFNVLSAVSNLESNVGGVKEIGKVCLYIVLFSKIGAFKETVKLSRQS